MESGQRISHRSAPDTGSLREDRKVPHSHKEHKRCGKGGEGLPTDPTPRSAQPLGLWGPKALVWGTPSEMPSKTPGPPPTAATFHPADHGEDHRGSRGQPARGAGGGRGHLQKGSFWGVSRREGQGKGRGDGEGHSSKGDAQATGPKFRLSRESSCEGPREGGGDKKHRAGGKRGTRRRRGGKGRLRGSRTPSDATQSRRCGCRRGVQGLGKPSELRTLSHSQRLLWKSCRWAPASARSLQSPEQARGPRHSSCARNQAKPMSTRAPSTSLWPSLYPANCPTLCPEEQAGPLGTGEEGRDGAGPAGRPGGLLLIKARRPHATALITVQYVMLF